MDDREGAEVLTYLSGSPASSFSTQYAAILSALLSPQMPQETNERTGEGISFCPAGAILSANLGNLPLIDLRRTHPKTAAAEVEWQVSGQTRLDILHSHDVHIWDKFAEKVGVDKLTISNAYGYRWRNYFGRDQLRSAVEALENDPTNRRVSVFAWDPGADGMDSHHRIFPKSTPCPVGFHLSTSIQHMTKHQASPPRDLNSTLWIRSSDVFVGLPYDVMGHTILMGLLANELKMGLGWLTVSLAHPHLYDVHRDMAKTALANIRAQPSVRISSLTLSEVENNTSLLFDYYSWAQRATRWPAYDPKPEVVL